MEPLWLYATGWDHIMGKPGVALFSFDEQTGELRLERMLDEEMSVGTVCLDAPNRIVHFVNEINGMGGQSAGGGCVTTCKIGDDGSLEKLDVTPTLCPNPSYAALDGTGEHMVVSNHSGGAVVTKTRRDAAGRYFAELVHDDAVVDLFAMTAEHRMGDVKHVVWHEPSLREGKPSYAHPHCAVFAPSGRFLAVCDKGNDGVYTYAVKGDRLIPCAGSPYRDREASAPRYAAFHPARPYLYVNHEGDFSVHTFRYAENGALTRLSSQSALPDGFMPRLGGRYDQQDLRMHPSGATLYDLLHGPDLSMVTAFAVGEGGSLNRIQSLSLQGRWPRACAISPDGRFLLVACMESGTIEVCAVGDDGRLSQIAQTPWQQGVSTLTFYRPQ